MDTSARFSGYAWYLLVISVSVFLLTGCGRKVWPTPQAAQDTFSWDQVNGTADKGCLRITAVLQGQSANLAAVSVELEDNPQDGACLSCPFQPQVSRTVALESPQLQLQGDRLTLTICDLSPQRTYRWRLRGTNIYSRLPAAVSVVQTTTIAP
ncbi:hypothetical protein [Desulfohalobium retbaense]|uniref:Lipoprotein n=1 Tax=Desulfohalobium retbaense (strain ATCC 49708 / DSM 5692 / JCM 16813 / HR100) TaxID=485915 RepID=C8X2H9_DESRD|nr:hypothetical protein [Desulfohalobium retbaense]ACV68626.1 putative lipoprotein [Desulfohalobium retbaense DSM 5692]